MPGWSELRQAPDDVDVFGSPAGVRSTEHTARSRTTPTNDWDACGERVAEVRPDSYIVSGAPPPCGQFAPRSPNEFLGVSVICARQNPDATGKDVVWYDISIRTTTHQWMISKRFSDLMQFHSNMKRLELQQYLGDANEASTSSDTVFNDFPPPFPSKYHLRRNHSPVLIEERRLQLDTYWKQVLQYLQALTLAAIGCKKPYSAALRAAFALMTECLRSSSQTETSEVGVWAKDDPYGGSSPLLKTSSSASEVDKNRSFHSPIAAGKGGGGAPASGSPLSHTASKSGIFSQEVDQHPPAKIIVEAGVRFSIVLFLPGVVLGNIYVDATAERGRSVIVGGLWNPDIHGLESLREQGVFQRSGSGAGAGGSGGGGGGGSTSADSGAQATSSRGATSARATTTGRQRSSTLPSRSPPPTGRGSALSTRRGERCTLMDTLPRGSFELVFDIPPPFERAHWYSEYEAGVLLLMWDAPPQ